MPSPSPARMRFNPLVAIVAAAVVLCFLIFPLGRGFSSFAGVQGLGGVSHVVLFQWKTGADPDAIQAANNRMTALKDDCVHPKHGRPYIVSLKGGRDNSIEGLQNGATHGFVVEFVSTEDRDYYVSSDPAHKNFVKSIGSIIEKATVLDFTDGQI